MPSATPAASGAGLPVAAAAAVPVAGLAAADQAFDDVFRQLTGGLLTTAAEAGEALAEVDVDQIVEGEGGEADPATDALCDGARCSGRVNARNSTGKDERSPYYDPRYDAPGRRFRLEESTHWTFFVSGGATF